MSNTTDDWKEKRKYQKWLDSLEVGDVVVVEHWNYGLSYYIKKIDRITPTRRIIVDNYIFTSDGRIYGNRYSPTYLREYTPEIVKKIKQQNIKRNVRNKLVEFYNKNFQFTDEQFVTFDNFFQEQGFYEKSD